MKTALKTAELQEHYHQLVFNDILGSDWETKLSEAGRCARQCDHDGAWARLAQVAREYQPSRLARLRDSVVDWLNE